MPINTPEDIKFEIVINIDGVDYYLDTNGSTAIPLNLSVGDIRDFATRKSSFSLSIKVPETSHNRFIFNSVSDLSVDLQYFNPNWKSPVTILCDSIPVFTGNLQLKSVDSELDGGEVWYNCVVYSESDDFFKTVGEYTLGGVTSNLDFSEYDHKYTYDNIVDSWNKDYQNGYFYPLIDTTGIINKSYIDGSISLVLMLTSGLTASLSSRLQISDFLPATYIKTIWDKIFETAGYKYESDFLNSEEFKNMIFPFSQKLLENNRDFLKTLSFYIGKSATQSFPTSIGSVNSITPNNLTNPTNLGWGPTAFPPGHKNINFQQYPGFYQWQALSFTNVTTPFDNSYGLWDTVNSKYTSTSELVQQEFKIKLELSFKDWGTTAKNALLAQDSHYIFGRDLVVVAVRSRDELGATVSGWSATPTFQDLLSFPRIPFFGGKSYHSIQYDQPAAASSVPPGYYQLTNLGDDGTGNDNKIASLEIVTDRLDGRPTVAATNTDQYSKCRYDSLFPGEEVRFFLVNYVYIATSESSSSYGGFDYFDPYSLTPNGLLWRNLSVNPNSTISNLVSSAVIAGQTLTYNSVLPQNLKQKDFLTSIVKMFNLYIEPSKDKSKTLYIEPRDVYYERGEIKDWSDKVNADKAAFIQVLAETQNKSTLFTYKGDSDYYNTDYSNIFKREYGDVKYVIDNDFLSGQKKVECIFSPTPMSLLNGTQDPRGMIYPSVFKLNNGKPQKANGFNFRILYKNPDGLIPLDSRDAWVFETTTQTSYPYAGHFYPDPYEPELDLNWGQSYLYFSNKPTLNNLFNRFWRKTINEISDINSRIVTLEMYLDSQDISDFKFSDNIYLVVDGVGGYYKVNKITNYDPTKIKPIMVEFIKSIDITVPIQSGLDGPDTESINLFSANETGSGRGRISITEYGNQVSGSGHIMTGVFNTVGNDGVIVNGNGNVLTSKHSLVIGDSNSDSSVKNTIILGDKNMSSQGQYKLLVGEGNTDSSSSSSLIVGTGNFVDINNSDVRALGNMNEITGPAKNITTFGNNNKLAGDITFVVGDTNFIDTGTMNNFIVGASNSIATGSSGSNIFGYNNVIGPSLSNIFLIGDNQTPTQSNTLYVNVPIILGPGGSIPSGSGTPNTIAYFDGTGALGSIFNVDDTLLSISVGTGTIASGVNSFAEGDSTIASGISSHSEGQGTDAIGDYSHAEGQLSQATGIAAHAEGELTEATGDYSHAEGNTTMATGVSSHSEGELNTASGRSAHTEGRSTIAFGDFSHAEGDGTTANGTSAHSEGIITIADAQGSHAEGRNTQALGNYSHAEGSGSITDGIDSHAGGTRARSSNYGEWSRSSNDANAFVGVYQYGIVSFIGNNVPNNAVTQVFLDGASSLFRIPQDGIYFIEVVASVKENTGFDFAHSQQIRDVFTVLNTAGTIEIYDSGGTIQTQLNFALVGKSTGTYGGNISIRFDPDTPNEALSCSFVLGAGAPVSTNGIVSLHYNKVGI